MCTKPCWEWAPFSAISKTGSGLAQQADQLGGQENGKEGDKHAQGRLGKFTPHGALENHALTLPKGNGDNRR